MSSDHIRNCSNQCDIFQTQKGSNKRSFILTRTHGMQIIRESPFVKPIFQGPNKLQKLNQTR